ncbi:hypothetical protein ACWDR0_03100 [Streptomyces sp. NPDC003691]
MSDRSPRPAAAAGEPASVAYVASVASVEVTSSAEVVEAMASAFRHELANDRRAAAETAYALAVLHRDRGDWTASRVWVRECLDLLDACPAGTEEQVATRRTAVGGVLLPALLHDGVVRARFGCPG